MSKLKRSEIPADAASSPDVIEDMQQKFCSDCGGVKSMTYKCKKVAPEDWIRFGMAIDIGCICKYS